VGSKREDMVNNAIINTCVGIFDEFRENLREVLKKALEEQKKADRRESNLERIKRDLAQAERRVKEANRLVLDSEGEEQENYRMNLRAELKRVTTLKAAMAQVQAEPAQGSTESILDAAAKKVDELLATLSRGGAESIPVIQAIMGQERLAVNRNGEAWEMTGTVTTVRLLDVVSPGALPGDGEVISGKETKGFPIPLAQR
jgi:DNA repair exonuclease SbcCD ATPase subunit